MTTTDTDALEPLMEPPPSLDADQARAMLLEHWDVAGTLTRLHGERDLNFRVDASPGARYVLKLQNPVDTVGVIAFQSDAARHIRLADPGLRVPDLVPTRLGRDWAETIDARGRHCLVRLLTFLDGHHPSRDELDEDDLYEWGRTAARLGRALRGFFHPEAGYPIAWDIKRLPAVRRCVPALQDEMRRAVLEVVDRHDERIAPALAGLRAQVVHNDLSRGNVLVDEHHAVAGITDFGDMTHTALVCDLAVSIADVLGGRPDALRLAERIIAGYAAVTPLEPAETDVLADLVAGRCALSIAIPAWRQSMDNSAVGPSPGAWPLLSALLAEGLDRVASRFARAAQPVPYLRRSAADLRGARDRSLGPLALSYSRPLHLVSGRGVELYDADGSTYIDAYNNVPVIGHSHPAVTEAVGAQLRLLNTNSRYLQEAPVELAERLLATVPGGRFDRVLFVNSGSEANDLAWRIARFATGGSGAIVSAFAYHGVTEATTALSPETWGDEPPPPHVRLVDPPSASAQLRHSAVEAAAADLDDAGHRAAAVFVDGIFTSDGIPGAAPAWKKEALAAIRGAGGLYIADEVQAGYGRTGDHLWSFAADHLDVDLVTLGKPMGNGYPVAAVMGSAELIDPFMRGTDYFSTFGGNTAACAAALAVLRTVEQDGLTENACAVGAHLVNVLGELARERNVIALPRGWGLAVGVDVCRSDDGAPDPETAARLVNRMREHGVLIGITGPDRATLKIRPPLVFTIAHADRLATELATSLADIES